MKILLYDPRYRSQYGAQQSMIYLAKGLTENNIDATIVTCKDGPLIDLAHQCGLKVQKCQVPRALDKFDGVILKEPFHKKVITLISVILYGFKLYFLVRRIKPDVLYANCSRSVFYLAISKVLIRRPLIWYLRGGYDFGIYTLLPTVIANKIILISSASIKAIHKKVRNIYKKKIVVNYIGIDVSKYGSAFNTEQKNKLRRHFGLPESGLLITSIGSINVRKGFDVLLFALKKVYKVHKDIHLVIAGTPNGEGALRYKTLLEKIINENNLPVTMLGWTNDVVNLLKATDIFVMASREEGLGRTILEAMASYVPPIVTRAGGSEETVRNNVSGFVVECEDTVNLSERLSFLIENENVRKRIGVEARKRCETVFLVDRYISDFMKIINHRCPK